MYLQLLVHQNVAAAETTLNDNDLVIDKTVTVIGDQVLPDSEELAKVEEVKTGSIQGGVDGRKSSTKKSNVMFSCQKWQRSCMESMY